MKVLLLSLLIILGLSSLSNAGEKILPYAAFGPQVAAHELIGMEWWQWQAVGGDEDREYPIQVVVYLG